MDDPDRRREEAAADFDEAEALGWIEEQLERRGHLTRDLGDRVTRMVVADEAIVVEVDRPIVWQPRANRRTNVLLAAEGGYSDAIQVPIGESGVLELSVEWSSLGLQVRWSATFGDRSDSERHIVLRFLDAHGELLREPVEAPLLAGRWPETLSPPGFDTSVSWALSPAFQ